MLLPRHLTLALILNTLAHRWRRIALLILTLYLLLGLNTQKHPFTTHPHAITPSSLTYEREHLSPSTTHHALLPYKEAKILCRTHTWPPYPRTPSTTRRVYDLFMLNDELDWLEIRLNTLAPYVDYFVILESSITFTGLPKPLVLKENWQRFKDFHAQIVYKVVEGMPVDAPRTWDKEDFQRNAMLLQGVEGIEGEGRAREGDVLVVSDVDEIPRPIVVSLLRECRTQRRVTVRTQFYYYGFEFRHRGVEWSHPQATAYREGWKTILPADLRNGEGGLLGRWGAWWDKAELWNGGWHCSTCFETVEEVLGKMRSFSHVGLNAEKFRDRTRIVDRVRKGLDLWDREGEVYEHMHDNQDIPAYLKANRTRWSFLLDRTKTNAGFKDYGPGEDIGD